jgi:hypothetical protein
MLRIAAAVPIVLALAAPGTGAETKRTEAASLRLTTPIAWERVPAPSDVRAAQYRIPRAPGDGEDGELILFFFGPGQGGGTQENLDRWYAQFEQPDGRPSRDAAVVTIKTVNALRISAVDLSGTYIGAQMPLGTARAPKPGYRLLGAIVEGRGGPWFFKALGPTATIAQAKPHFDAMLASLEVHR